MVAPTTLPGRAYVRASTEKVSRLLFHWRARDLALAALTGQVATFSRASAGGAVLGVQGTLRTPVHSQPRFEMVDLDGDGVNETPGFLLEQQRTNYVLNGGIEGAVGATPTSINPTAGNAVVVATDVVGIEPNGRVAKHTRNPGSTGDTNCGAQFVSGLSPSTTYTASVWVYVPSTFQGTYVRLYAEGTGVVATVIADANLAKRDRWQRLTATVTTTGVATGFAVTMRAASAVDGDVFYSDAWQVEAGNFVSSWIPTTGAPAARAQDALTWPFLAAPQPLTLYARYLERGPAIMPANSGYHVIADLGGGGAAGTHYFNLRYETTNRRPQIAHQIAGGAGVFSSPGVTPAMGDLVELRAVLFADGSVQLGMAFNGGAESVGAQSTPNALATTWGTAAIALNNSANALGTIGAGTYLDLKVAAGVRDLQTMREAF